MQRRQLFGWIGRLAAGLGLGGLPGVAALRPSRQDETLPPLRRSAPVPDGPGLDADLVTYPVPPRPVHWVSLDRRHIQARLVAVNQYQVARLELEDRPPVLLSDGSTVTYPAIIERVPHDAGEMASWRPNSWHEPESLEVRPAKRCMQWWYKQSPDESEAVTPKPRRFLLYREGEEPPLWRGEDDAADAAYVPPRLRCR